MSSYKNLITRLALILFLIRSIGIVTGTHKSLLAREQPPVTALGDSSAIGPAPIGPVLRAALNASLVGDRTKAKVLLDEAIAAEADSELARWHGGQIHWNGKWLSEAEIVASLASDDDYQNYLAQRGRLAGNPNAEFHLARWCKSHDFDDFARFHFMQVVHNANTAERLRVQAFEQLDLQWYDGQLLTAQQLAERTATAKRQQAVAKLWADAARRWARDVSSTSARRASAARKQMQQLSDVDAIPLLEQTMSATSESSALAVVQWLAQRPHNLATQSLMRHALLTGWESVTQAAIDALAERPLHEFVPPLLGQLVPPIESRFMVASTPAGLVVHRHQILRHGEHFNEAATADFVRTGGPMELRGSRLRGTSRFTSPRRESVDERVDRFQRTQLLAFEAKMRSATIEKEVAATNAEIEQHNARYFRVLNGATAANVAANPILWWDWWDDYNERFMPPKSTRFRYGQSVELNGPIYDVRSSCFVAGTPVRTDCGPVAIDLIKPGQRVLAQDVDSGELGYKIVTATTERPPSPLLAIDVGTESIVATLVHPILVNGKGWRMAKQLAAGDVLHTLQGPGSIHSIRSTEPAVAYNLVVSDFNDYFVGTAGLLVHDNQPRQPTRAVTPGLSRY